MRSTAQLIADTARMIGVLEHFYSGSVLQKSQSEVATMRADLRDMDGRLTKLELQGMSSGMARNADRLAKMRGSSS